MVSKLFTKHLDPPLEEIMGLQSASSGQDCDWYLLNHDFFTHKRVHVWGINLGAYLCYNTQIETINHLFFEYREVHRRWAIITVLLIGTRLEVCFNSNSLWDIIKGCIMQAKWSLVPIIIAMEMLNSTWRERNGIFQLL